MLFTDRCAANIYHSCNSTAPHTTPWGDQRNHATLTAHKTDLELGTYHAVVPFGFVDLWRDLKKRSFGRAERGVAQAVAR